MLLNCYIMDCFLFDKVIDLMDEVVLCLCMQVDFKLEELDEIDCCLLQLKIEVEVLKKEKDFVFRDCFKMIEGEIGEL